MSDQVQSGFSLARQIALYQQHLEKEHCDLVIKIKDEEFFVHSCMIAAACPKLHDIIEGSKVATDVNSGPSYEVEIDNKVFTPENFEFVLSYIYLGALDWDKVTPELVTQVLKAAEWCGFEQLSEDYMSMNRTHDTEASSIDDGSTIIMVDTFGDLEENGGSAVDMDDLAICYSETSQSLEQSLYCIFCGKEFDSVDNDKLVEHMKEHNDEQTAATTSKRGNTRRKASLKVKEKYKSLLSPSKHLNSDDFDIDYENERVAKRSSRISMFSKEFVCKNCDKKLPTMRSLKAHIRRQCKSRESIGDGEESLAKNEVLQENLMVELSKVEQTKSNQKSTKALTVRTGDFIRTYRKKKNRQLSDEDYFEKPSKRAKVAKLWVCPLCPEYVFERKNDQVVHIKEVHGVIKRYACEECGKELDGRNALALHMRIHTGERPFSCPVCGQGFSEKKTMEDHTRRHTGERPFLCTVCGKDFTFRQSLYRHMKFHNGDRPHQCHICGKSFVLKQNLREHITRHNKHKLIKCSHCFQQFSNQELLNNHLQNEHAFKKPAPVQEDTTVDSMEQPKLTIVNITSNENSEPEEEPTEYEVTIEEAILEHYEA